MLSLYTSGRTPQLGTGGLAPQRNSRLNLCKHKMDSPPRPVLCLNMETSCHNIHHHQVAGFDFFPGFVCFTIGSSTWYVRVYNLSTFLDRIDSLERKCSWPYRYITATVYLVWTCHLDPFGTNAISFTYPNSGQWSLFSKLKQSLMTMTLRHGADQPWAASVSDLSWPLDDSWIFTDAR